MTITLLIMIIVSFFFVTPKIQSTLRFICILTEFVGRHQAMEYLYAQQASKGCGYWWQRCRQKAQQQQKEKMQKKQQDKQSERVKDNRNDCTTANCQSHMNIE